MKQPVVGYDVEFASKGQRSFNDFSSFFFFFLSTARVHRVCSLTNATYPTINFRWELRRYFPAHVNDVRGIVQSTTIRDEGHLNEF